MPTRRVAALIAAFVLVLPTSGWSAILYQASAGFFPQPYGFNLFRGDDFAPASVDSGEFGLGGLCPAAGTPNYLCGRARGAAGINGGRIFLKAEARLKRSDADPMLRETFAYGGARVTITSMGSSPVQTGSSPAAFYFRLDGTLVNTRSDASVTTQAFSTARLSTGDNVYRQCFGPIDCPPGQVATIKTTNWDVNSGFVLDLRVDAGMLAPVGFGGWSAETVADFADTMELVAIALLDENDQPRTDEGGYLDQLRRAPEPQHAHGHPKVHETDGVLKEDRESSVRGSPVGSEEIVRLLKEEAVVILR